MRNRLFSSKNHLKSYYFSLSPLLSQVIPGLELEEFAFFAEPLKKAAAARTAEARSDLGDLVNELQAKSDEGARGMLEKVTKSARAHSYFSS